MKVAGSLQKDDKKKCYTQTLRLDAKLFMFFGGVEQTLD